MNYKWFMRNIVYRLKGFSLRTKDIDLSKNKKVIFYMDKHRKYPGFVDLLKAIVGTYYIAKLNGYDYKIYFETPFQLSKYFLPPKDGKVNWIMTTEEIANINELPFSIGLLNYYGIGNIPQLTKSCYQVRNFIGWNILQRNKQKNWELTWSMLYSELFTPSDYLQSALDKLLLKENSYIAIHVRFVNALELAELDYAQRPLNDEQKNVLMLKCYESIKKIETKEKLKAIVFSDSSTFLNFAKQNGSVVLDGNVGHITYNSSDDVVLKMFIDLYAISRARKVFMLRGDKLYDSAFPIYASLIGSKPSKIVNITI